MLEGNFIFKRNNQNSQKSNKINPCEQLSLEEQGFKQYFIYVDKSLRKLVFLDTNTHLIHTEIFISDFLKIEISKKMENLFAVHKLQKKLNNSKIDPNEYFDKFQNKFLENDYYVLSLYLTTNVRLEFVFTSFEEFKIWNKGINEIISNRMKLSRYKSRIKQDDYQ